MLKPRTLILLAAAVVVLGGISLLQRNSHRDATGRSSTAVVVPGEFTAADLGRLTLGRGDQSEAVVLSNGPDGWRVDSVFSAPANPQRVEALLRNVSGLKGEFRSDHADVLADYGLDPAGAVTLRGFDPAGQEVFALDVGNSPDRQPGNFIRNPASDAVYLSRQSVLNVLGIYGEPAVPGGRHFLDLQAVTADRLAVDAITLRDAAGEWTLSKVIGLAPPPEGAPADTPPTPDRATWEWKLSDGTAPAKTKADAVLGAAVSIRAVDVGDPTADPSVYGLDTPVRIAVLDLQDGSQVTLMFGAVKEPAGDDPGGTWMRVDGEPGVWLVTEYTVNNIFKTATDLMPE